MIPGLFEACVIISACIGSMLWLLEDQILRMVKQK